MLQVEEDIRVVLAIDFGTTYSGYAYAHVKNPARISVEDKWEGYVGRLKTPTVIKYTDETYTTVDSWGYPALARKPSKQDKINSEKSKGKEKEKPSSTKPVELFKLHLSKSFKGNLSLPDHLDYRKVITDYMKELWKSVKVCLQTHWQELDFHNQVSIILTVPAEFADNEIKIVRECAFNAGLMKEKFSNNLQFTTEPEAAAIHCLDSIAKEEHNLVPGDLFMVVDCGGGTVDITTREILEDNKLGEVTVREGDFCGSSFVDEAFLSFIGNITGTHAIDQMKKYHYDILQYIVKEFRAAKFPFTGEETGFEPYEFDLDEIHVMKQYIVGEKRKNLEEKNWYIEIGFEEIKEMFDPVIEKIIHLIRGQLNQIEKNCSAMFLVGGFSESQYLQSRIKNEFLGVIPSISIPTHPIASVLNG
ncbi:6266_t:CDS:2, partial [Funneliformis mosseae]